MVIQQKKAKTMAKVIMINTKTRTIRVENTDKNIDWITVKGTHVPIEKGQSKSAAVKSFVESKRGGKSDWEKQFGPLDKPVSKSAVKRIQKEDFEKNVKDAERRNAEEKASKAREKALKDQEEADFQKWKKQQPAKASSEQTKEIDAKIKDKKQELQNIIKSLSENVEGGYFDIAQEMMTDVEYVKGELKQLMDERAKMLQQPAKKTPKQSEPERDWYRGEDEDEDAYYDRRDKTMAEARKIDKVSDWYQKAFKGDDDGLPTNKNITFKELADGLLSGDIKDFYETVGTGESDVREKIFRELSERTGRPYDDFYDAWLYGGKKGTESRKAKAKEDMAKYDKILKTADLDPEIKKLITKARDRAKKES